jgi:transcriptional regulator NrdR family protein
MVDLRPINERGALRRRSNCNTMRDHFGSAFIDPVGHAAQVVGKR